MKTQRFERIVDGHREVWEIWLQLRDITIKSIAPKPKARAKQTHEMLPSKVAALAEYERRLAEKRADGWTAKLDQHGNPLKRAVLRNLELDAEILASPDERDAYLVYGDWLTEQGDPRGELVTIQAALDDAPGDKKLKARVGALHKAHDREWLGELWETRFEDSFRPPNTFRWRWGFVESAWLRDSLRESYRVLRAMPSTAFVRDLRLDLGSYGGRDEVVTDVCADPPPLPRSLTIDGVLEDPAASVLIEVHEKLGRVKLRLGGDFLSDRTRAALVKCYGPRVEIAKGR